MKKLYSVSLIIWTICVVSVAAILYYGIWNNYSDTNPLPTILSNLLFIFIVVGSISFLALIISKLAHAKSKIGFYSFLVGTAFLALIVLEIAYMASSNDKTAISQSIPQSTTQYSNKAPIMQVPSPTPKSIPVKKKLDGGLLFNLVNEYRASQGLQQMGWWHQLCEYSTERSEEVKDDWSHQGYQEDSTQGSGKLYQSVCPECIRTGENLAKDYWTEKEILNAWIGSPSHKANLDDPSWNVGCAIVYNNNYTSFEFGQRSGQ